MHIVPWLSAQVFCEVDLVQFVEVVEVQFDTAAEGERDLETALELQRMISLINFERPAADD